VWNIKEFRQIITRSKLIFFSPYNPIIVFRIFSFLQVVAGLRSSSGFLIFILYEGLILHTQLRTWFSFDWNNE